MWIKTVRKQLLLASLLMSVSPLATTAVEAAEIYRDANGVAQIYGKDNFDVFAGYGYVAGKDRMFQLEMRRRQAFGTTAEVLGAGDNRWLDKYTSKDKEARRELDVASFNAQIQTMGLNDRAIVEGYVTGLNRAIEEALADPEHKLSRQFRDYGFLPGKWTVLDVLVTSASELAFYSDLAFQSADLTLYTHLRKHFPKECDDIFNQLLWTHDPYAVTTMQDQAQPNSLLNLPPPQGCADLGNAPNKLLLPVGMAKLLNSDESIPAGQPRRASMAWGVGGKMAGDGAKTVFLSGPQTGWHRPSYYYVVGLHGGDFDFVGMAPSALLPMEVGVSAHHSWGMTAGLGMQKDLFQEHLKPQNADKYKHREAWLKFTHRHEVIYVKNAEPLNFDVISSIHGPLISRHDEGGVVYSSSTAWKGGEVRSVLAWLHSAHAQTTEEWLTYARQFDYNYNWFYGDRDGAVGFAYTGKFPIRRPDHDVRLPVAGTGEFDYPGFLNPADNPHMFTHKFIANFNNKPTRNWPNSGLFFEQWGVGNQAEILFNEFAGKQTLNAAQIWDINRKISVADVNAYPLVPFIADAAKLLEPNSEEAKAAAFILAWDKQRLDANSNGFYDTPGQVIFEAWLPIMVEKLLNPVLKGWDNAGFWISSGYQKTAPRLEEHPSAGTMTLIEALNFRAGHGAIPQYHDFFEGRDPRAVINEALTEALAKIRETHHVTMENWANPVLIQRYFASNANRIPMTATGPETNFGAFANRGSVNLLSEYDSDGNLQAYYVNPLGGSDFIPPAADHATIPDFRHHLDLYAAFKFAPLYLKKEDVLKNLGPVEPVMVEFK